MNIPFGSPSLQLKRSALTPPTVAVVETRFCIEVAKDFTSGALEFYDPSEWAKLQQLYGSLKHLQGHPTGPGADQGSAISR